MRIYCWTGARLSTFFSGGFRYGGSCLQLLRHEYILTQNGHRLGSITRRFWWIEAYLPG